MDHRVMRAALLVTTCLVASPALADPISVVLAAVTSFGPMASVLGTGAILGTAWGSFATRLVLGYALNALSASLAGDAGAQGQGGHALNTLGPAEHRAIIYGEVKVGGVVFFRETTVQNKYLHQLIAVAAHEIDSFQTIYLNDEEVTIDGDGEVTAPDKYVGLVRIKLHTGSTTQAADADLVAESDGNWTESHRARGVAYIYARFKHDDSAYPNGVPVTTALVRGKNTIYDPRDLSTGYSSNAALCLRDYLRSSGIAASYEISEADFITAADICDESVTLDVGGTESRYVCNGAFLTSLDHKNALNNILSAMGGMMWYSMTSWGAKAAAYTTPTITFDEDDLRSNIEITTRKSRRDNFNRISGLYRGPDTNWQSTNYPQVVSDTFLSIDGNRINRREINFPFTTSTSAVQRLAKIALYRNREQITISVSLGLRGLLIRPGSIVMITNSRLGFSSKPFEVLDWSFGMTGDNDLQAQVLMQEISSGVFDWDAEEAAFESNNTTLASPFSVPAVGITFSSVLRVINEHLSNVIIVNTTSASAEQIDIVQVEFKKSADAEYTTLGTGELGLFEWVDAEATSYDIRARALNSLGVKGDWSYSLNNVVNPEADAPEDVTGFSGEVNSSVIVLSWDTPSELDISFYRIRHSSEEAGTSWANATTLVDKVPRPATNVSVPARPGTYHIKVYDKLGNASTNYTSVVIPATYLETFTTTLNQVEDATFTGTKTDCSVTSSELRITSPGTAPTEATYEFSTYIDAGSSKLCRVRIDIEVNRVDGSAGDWDDMPGNWDSFPGNWDDWTGNAQFADHNVVAYVRTTADDPAGAPTWSDWVQFKAGSLYARAFDFKVVLSSTSDNITPSISGLEAIVEHN